MRETKFRVWDRRNKELIYPDTITFDSFGRLYHLEWAGPGDEIFSVSADLLKMPDGSERFIVEESTGLKDKNGTDLDWWEGDKFRIDGHLYAIVLDKGCFWFDGIYMPFRHTADSVSRRPNGNVPNKIGTIHDEEEAHANRS